MNLGGDIIHVLGLDPRSALQELMKMVKDFKERSISQEAL